MHRKYGRRSVATKNARSETPEGFAYGFFVTTPSTTPCWPLQIGTTGWTPSYCVSRLMLAFVKGIDALIADAYFF